MLEKIQIVEKVTLKQLRKLTGMCQSDFAEYVGIPFTTYRRYESNPRDMSSGKLADLCKKLDVDISMIILD